MTGPEFLEEDQRQTGGIERASHIREHAQRLPSPELERDPPDQSAPPGALSAPRDYAWEKG